MIAISFISINSSSTKITKVVTRHSPATKQTRSSVLLLSVKKFDSQKTGATTESPETNESWMRKAMVGPADASAAKRQQTCGMCVVNVNGFFSKTMSRICGY